MKKLLVILLAICMAAMPVLASAEAELTYDVILNWEDYAEVADAVEGDFVGNEALGAMFWLPAFLQELDVPADMANNMGVVALYASEDGAYQMAVSMQSFERFGGLVPYLEMLADQGGADEFEDALINDIYAISYEVKSADGACVLFPIDENSGMTFMFFPMSDADFATVAFAMMASFQVIE